jgi:hypothetical protein
MLFKSLVLALALATTAGAALAGDAGPVAGGDAARTSLPSISIGGLSEYKSAVRQNYATVNLPAGAYVDVPAMSATVSCKSGVSKCVIEVDLAVQISATSGWVALCPAVDGVGIDDCRTQSVTGNYFVYSALAFAQKSPGTTHTVTLRATSSTGGSLFFASGRYHSLYK